MVDSVPNTLFSRVHGISAKLYAESCEVNFTQNYINTKVTPYSAKNDIQDYKDLPVYILMYDLCITTQC